MLSGLRITRPGGGAQAPNPPAAGAAPARNLAWLQLYHILDRWSRGWARHPLGSNDRTIDDSGADVRRRRHPDVAGVARNHAEAVRAADRGPLDLPADAATGERAGPVRPPDRDHQPGFPL